MESGNDRPVDWELLTRHVAGECSDEEEVIVEAWAATDPRSRQLLKDLRQAWETLGRDEEAPLVDVDAAWKQLNRRMREEETRREETPRPERAVLPADRPATAGGQRKRRPGRRRAGPRSEAPGRRWRAAAAVGLALGVFALALLLLGEPWPGGGEAAGGKVFTTQRGQRAIIELTDGTEVQLNAESRLVLPGGGFSEEGRREVRLRGEAFFEVARDTARPFLVHTTGGGPAVHVLGTAFNVEAYSADTALVQVAVAEGEVALQAAAGKDPGRDTLRLQPRQVGIARLGGALEARRGVDLSARLAWTEGRLAFEDAPFGEVARKLERWYDLRVKVRPPAGTIDRLNAQFDDESLQDILGDIAVALGLRYERSQDVVTFYRRRSGGRPAAPGGVGGSAGPRPEVTQ